MLVIIGAIVVVFCVFGGYLAHGGNLLVLWQPTELLIIGGAALGAFLTANPMHVVKRALAAFVTLLKGSPYNKQAYLELLSLQYQVFKLAKSKGPLALEQHVENPHESSLFTQFPKFLANHHAMEFFCDYLRMITLGTENKYSLDDLLTEEIATHHHEATQVSSAVQNVADGLPALGIVAAVLGVIITMGKISEPPEVLGHSIGAALVGTFLGVLMAYGFVGPTSTALKHIYDAESKYYECIKAGLLAYVEGYAPQIAVEFARKAVLSEVRPTFYEVEEAVQALPAPG